MSLKSERWNRKIYLLTEDKKGEVKSKKFKLFSNDSQIWKAKKGIFLEENSDDEQPSDREKLFLRSIDNPQNTVTVHISQVYKLSDEYYLLMKAVPVGLNRVEILREQGKLREGKSAKIGDLVNVETKSGIFEAIIQYKGPISGENGIFFGVEFERKVGSCDGKPYFECEDQYGSFVALHDIHFIDKHEKTQPSNYKTSNENIRSQFISTSGYTGMKIGTKVFCLVPGNQYPLRGFIVYLGPKENNIDPVPVGVQFYVKPSKPIKKGNFYNGQKLFECPKGLGYVTTDMSSLSVVEENEGYVLISKKKENFSGSGYDANYPPSNERNPSNFLSKDELSLKKIDYQQNCEVLNEKVMKMQEIETKPYTAVAIHSGLKQISSLQINDMVEFQVSGTTYYGVLMWRGFVESVMDEIAGIELEEFTSRLGTTDGTYKGKRFFECLSSRGYFLELSRCKPDRRFQD